MRALILFLALLIAGSSTAQTDIAKYRKYKAVGDSLFAADRFPEAIDYYRVAEIHARESQKKELEQSIENANSAYAAQFERESNRAESGRILTLAMESNRYDQTTAFRLTEKALEVDSTNEKAGELKDELVKNGYFYQKRLRFSTEQLVLHPKKDRIISARDGVISVWDFKGVLLDQFGTDDREGISFTSMDISADGKYLIVGDEISELTLWDLEEKKMVHRFEAHLGNITQVKFSPKDYQLLTYGDDEMIKLWDLSGKHLRTFDPDRYEINYIGFIDEGRKIVAGTKEGDVLIWGKEEKPVNIHTLSDASVNCLFTSGRDSNIFVGTDEGLIYLLDESGEILGVTMPYEKARVGVKSIQADESGKELIAGFSDGNIGRYRYFREKTQKRNKLPYSIETVNNYLGHDTEVLQVMYAYSNSHFLSWQEDGTIILWPIDHRLIYSKTIPIERYDQTLVSPDGQRFISYRYKGSLRGNLRMWTRYGELLWSKELGSRLDPNFLFSPDNRFILVWSKDSTYAKLINITNGKIRQDLSGSQRKMTAVDFSLDINNILMAYADSTLAFWKKENKIYKREVIRLNKKIEWIKILCDKERALMSTMDSVFVLNIIQKRIEKRTGLKRRVKRLNSLNYMTVSDDCNYFLSVAYIEFNDFIDIWNIPEEKWLKSLNKTFNLRRIDKHKIRFISSRDALILCDDFRCYARKIIMNRIRDQEYSLFDYSTLHSYDLRYSSKAFVVRDPITKRYVLKTNRIDYYVKSLRFIDNDSSFLAIGEGKVEIYGIAYSSIYDKNVSKLSRTQLRQFNLLEERESANPESFAEIQTELKILESISLKESLEEAFLEKMIRLSKSVKNEYPYLKNELMVVLNKLSNNYFQKEHFTHFNRVTDQMLELGIADLDKLRNIRINRSYSNILQDSLEAALASYRSWVAEVPKDQINPDLNDCNIDLILKLVFLYSFSQYQKAFKESMIYAPGPRQKKFRAVESFIIQDCLQTTNLSDLILIYKVIHDIIRSIAKYSVEGNSDQNKFYEEILEYTEQKIEEILKTKRKISEFPCYSGAFSNYLSATILDSTNLSLSVEDINTLRVLSLNYNRYLERKSRVELEEAILLFTMSGNLPTVDRQALLQKNLEICTKLPPVDSYSLAQIYVLIASLHQYNIGKVKQPELRRALFCHVLDLCDSLLRSGSAARFLNDLESGLDIVSVIEENDSIRGMLLQKRNQIGLFKTEMEVSLLTKQLQKTPDHLDRKIDLSKAYGKLSRYQLFNGMVDKAVRSANEGLLLGFNQHWIHTPLALAYLLSDQYDKAEELYLAYMNKEYPEEDYPTYREAFLNDLDEVELLGIHHPDIPRIRALLQEGQQD